MDRMKQLGIQQPNRKGDPSMTTLVICDCGRVQEYDESLSLKCQHCEIEVIWFDDVVMEEDEYET